MNSLTHSADFWPQTIVRSLKLALLSLVLLGGNSLRAGAWTKYLSAGGGDENWSATPPVDVVGNVFFCSSRGTVLALRSIDGSEVWRTELGGRGYEESLITREGYLVTGSRREERGFLFALDTVTGKPVWTNYVGDYYITVGATSPDGVVYAMADGKLMAIGSSDGITRWSTQSRFHGGSLFGASLSIGHGVVTVFEDVDGVSDWSYIHAFDVNTGTLRWTRKGASTCAVPSSDGTFVVTSASRMTVVSATNGMPGWSGVVQNSSTYSPFSFATTNLAFGLYGGPYLYRFDTATKGFSRLKPLKPNARFWQPTVSADGRVYVPTSTGGGDALVVFGFTNNFSSEAIPLWQANVAEYSTSPVIAPDGTIVVTSYRGAVQAFAGTAPLAVTHWPKARGDMANSACEPSFYSGEPTILLAPTNQATIAGTSVALPASVKGLRPLKVHWFKDGIPLGSAQAAYWPLPVTAPTDTGDYHFIASNALGSVTSSPVHLQVNLSLAVGVEGGGSVTRSSPANIFTNGTTVALEAVPLPGASFLGWTGDVVSSSPSISVSMTKNQRILARFSLVPGKVKFVLRQGAWNGYDHATPAIAADGTVYHVYRSELYALDGQTGLTKWTFTAPEGFSNWADPLILDDGAILVATSTNTVCLDPVSHQIRWRIPTSQRLALGELVYTWQSAWINNRWHYQPFAVRPDSGALEWEADEVGWIPHEPLLMGDSLFLGHKFRFQSANGAVLRTTNVNPNLEVVSSANAIGADGTLFGWTEGRGVVARDPQSGALKWVRGTGTQYGVGSPPIVGPDNVVYAGIQEGRFYALDGFTGNVLWILRLTTGPVSGVRDAAALAADGTLYVASGGSLSAINSANGTLSWQYGFTNAFGVSDGYPTTAPTIGPDGTVYVGTDYGLIALVGTAPLAQAPWPKHRGDLRNTGRRADFPPLLVDQPKPWMYADGQDVSLRVQIAAQPAATVQWFFKDQPISNATNTVLKLRGFSPAHAGSYYAIASNAVGKSHSEEITVYHNDLPRLDFFGVQVPLNESVNARIEDGPTPEGPWTLVEEVTFPKGANQWLDTRESISAAHFYRLTTSSRVDLWPARVSGTAVQAPLGSRQAVEFVDPQTGWENWQRLTNITVLKNPTIVIDPTILPPNPRFYRITPAN